MIKARRATIELGDRILQVFQLADGEYGLSQTQVGKLPGKDENYVRKFLGSKSLEALPYKDYTPVKLPVEGERTRINLISIDLAIAFWTKEATAGNAEAARLLGACAVESIERRADKAFGIERTETERNQRLVATFQRLGDIFPVDEISFRYQPPTPTGTWMSITRPPRCYRGTSSMEFQGRLMGILCVRQFSWLLEPRTGDDFPNHRRSYPTTRVKTVSNSLFSI